MRRGSVILLLTLALLAIVAAGGAVFFGQSLVRPGERASGPPGPPATPPFARFTAADVVATFRSFGLPAENAHPLSAENQQAFYGDVPLGRGQVAAFLDPPSGGTFGHVLVFDNAPDQETAWQYLQRHAWSGAFIKRSQIRNANLILVFLFSSKNPPDLSSYNAAFIGLR